MAGSALFDPSLISPTIHESASRGYAVRPLAREDYSKGYFDCLATLTWVASPSQQEFEQHFDWMTSKGAEWFYNVVIEYEGKVVGTGVVIVEQKL